MHRLYSMFIVLMLLTTACSLEETGSGGATGTATDIIVPVGDRARVISVYDGDTITVEIDGERYRVRYIGVNTPELSNGSTPAQVCGEEAARANRELVDGQIVTLVKDVSETDRFDRLLRYVYLDDVFVNLWLVENGWAEAARYDPDTAFYETFRDLELDAAAENRGCHPTGIFDDGSSVR